MELKANPDAVSEGAIIEARQEVGRGPTATVIVQKGTLRIGDSIHCGDVYCKVKAMIDDQGNQVKSAPSKYTCQHTWMVRSSCSRSGISEDVRMNARLVERLMNICKQAKKRLKIKKTMKETSHQE